jgi:eukaryotic-like serine/threonine-protein kinase
MLIPQSSFGRFSGWPQMPAFHQSPSPRPAMPTIPPEEAKSRRTVLELLGDRSGKMPKLLLPDSGSEHGASPILDPGSSTTKPVPQGRNKYQMIGEIARGGMGVILKGHDTDLGRDVAVKVLDPELAKNPAVVSRFVEEAQIGGQLQHPGIVPVYELGLMADDSPYFTMKLVKGRTLSALLSQRKSTSDNRTRLLSIFESVCQTIAYAHSKGVLHRDIKPANIMVGAFGEVQVVDWGLAKVLHRGGVADEQRAKQSVFTIIETVRSGPGSSGSDSMMGSVMGTPAYMSPEQAQGEIEKLDERADVFSLGATLCEILTGRPPYEGTDSEPTLVLAARAKLDPARGRIEACDADPMLKSLCLECMLPARDARPRDAEAVARAVHDYLSSVEERAHQAELAATAARIKAAEERRGRRLVLALAGTVLCALMLGGGGFYWVHLEREARVAQVRTAVEAAFGESIQLGQDGRALDALEAARRGQALTATSEVDEAMRERAARFVQQAELAVSAADRERDLLAKDTALQQRLVDLRLAQIPTIGNREREAVLHAEFVKAFQDYGVDLDGDQITPALERIRERHIAEEVALALDDLGRLRRNLFGEQAVQFQRTAVLAMDLDPDADRLRLREAIQQDDLSALLELAAPENLGNLPPGSIWVLSATLWDRYPEHRPDVYRMFDQALYLYPNDYVLQSVGAMIYRMVGRKEATLACRTAAFSLQPENVQARYDLADSLFFAGRMVDALGVYLACTARSPKSALAWNGLGWTQFQLGDFAGATASFQKAAELDANPQFASDLEGARYMSGLGTKAAMEDLARSSVVANEALNYCLALADAPDGERRNPELAIARVRDETFAEVYAKVGSVIEAIARVHLEDYQGALEALQHFDPKSDYLILTPLAFPFLRALIYARLGQQGTARECYARGMEGWSQLVGNEEAGWERSDIKRWRTAAEQALGL